MPFSRQHTLTALSFMPLVPWALKVKFVQVGASGRGGHCRALRGGSRPVCECARGAGSGAVKLDDQAYHRACNLPPALCSGGSRSSSSTPWASATCRPPGRWMSRIGQVGAPKHVLHRWCNVRLCRLNSCWVMCRLLPTGHLGGWVLRELLPTALWLAAALCFHPVVAANGGPVPVVA